MTLTERRDVFDKYGWRCMNTAYISYQHRIGLRSLFLFENFKKISLIDLFTISFYWSQEKLISCISDDFGIQKKIIMAVFTKLRDVISSYLLLEPIHLGGPGVICQIDESLFSHKIKAHRGRAPRKQIWGFGIVDKSRSPALCYLEIVARRNAETLLPIIARIVRPGNTIHPDEWAAYKSTSSSLGFLMAL